MARFFVGLILSVVATVILMFFAGMAGGICHCMTTMFALFPYGSIVTMRTSWESAGLILTFFQFPLYTLIVQILRSSQPRALAILVILAVHTLAAMLGLRSQ